jgi:hypothetical protein
LTRGAVLAVPVFALAACGGTTTSDGLEDAAKETAESSSRIEMTYETTDGTMRGSMTGAFDYAADRAIVTEVEFAESELLEDEPQPTEVRVVGGADYLRYEVDGKTYWVKEQADRGGDPFALLFPIPGGAQDPSDVFAMVLRASDKIENIGLERVRGDEATHYRATVELRELAKEVPEGERDEFLDGMKAGATLPVDLWVDTESRLRRIGIREEFTEDISMRMSFELFDYGVDVDVEPPPADQVITHERLDELTGEGWTEYADEDLKAFCREEAPKGEADQICEETEAPE